MDLLYQIIKGTLKDHIVDWVEEYVRALHDNAEAERILADIDRRYIFSFSTLSVLLTRTCSIAITPPFPGLRHFPVGRGFKKWTGNDSKGLMKVYIKCSHRPGQ
jgi:hypothetical protein